MVGRVINGGSRPSSVPAVYLVNPVTIGGPETEDAVASRTPNPDIRIPVNCYGPTVPALGDDLDCFYVGHRWVSTRRLGGGGPPTGTLLGCVCPHPPATLPMTVASGTCSDGRFYSTTLTYKPTPPDLGALQLGGSCYLSDDSFPDPQTGDYFFYFMSCFSSVVRISRVFPTSIYGSPFLDSVIYFWTLGFPGNTCTPFYLSKGTVFAGGDPNCKVIIG